MSKKPNKGKKSKVEKVSEEESNASAVEIGYLTGAILDYYESTGRPPLEEGDEWKDLDPEKYRPKGLEIPEELDKEIMKAFIAQIKKFQ
jgi:hypothetical protein